MQMESQKETEISSKFLNSMKKTEKLLQGFGELRGKKVRAGSTEILVSSSFVY